MIRFPKQTMMGLAAAMVVGLAGCSKKPESEAPAPAAVEPATVAPATEVADMVLTNGKFYTVNDKQPWTDAMAVRGGEIVYVGDNAGAQAFVGDRTKVEDLGGKFVMPGMIATHEHSIFYMGVSSGLMFKELYHDKDKMLADLKVYLQEQPDGPYMSFGGGYYMSE